MLSRLRHELRMIRYYSARRARTGWTIARDVALVVSLLLAVPATWLSSVMARRPGPVTSIEGLLMRHEDGLVWAWITDVDATTLDLGDRTRFIGTFSLTQAEYREGWPLATMVDKRAVALNLDLFSETAPQEDVDLTADDPIVRAVNKSLLEAASEPDGLDSTERYLYDAWRSGDPGPDHIVLGWVGSIGIWWVMLTVSSVLVIEVLGFVWRLFTAHGVNTRRDRRIRGFCEHCGYDMRGLEFNERCPECGTLV